MSLRLAYFPDDILENIFTASAGVVAIWLCGDRALNARLARGACTSFVANVHEVVKWPRMLPELKSLRRLIIRADYTREPPERMHGELFKLPKTMEVIAIDFPGATSLILDEPKWVPPQDRLVHTQSHLPKPVFVNIAEMFPLLRELDLVSPDSGVLELVKAKDLKVFPPTLEHLGLCVSLMEGFEALPPNLRIFDMAIGASTNLSDDPLPIDLPHLKRYGSRCLKYLGDSFPILNYPAVESLYSRNWNEDMAHLPSLTELQIANTNESFPKEWTAQLPRSLRKLTCGEQLTVAQLDALPNSLSSLAFQGVLGGYAFKRDGGDSKGEEADYEIDLSFWPSQLGSLEIVATKLGAKDFRHLPRKLTALTRIMVDFRVTHAADFALLPPGLTNLHLSQVQARTLEDDDQDYRFEWQSYLPGLKVLSFHFHQLDTSHFPQALTKLSVSYISLEHFAALPRTLTELHHGPLQGSMSDDHCFACLPQGLKHWHGILNPPLVLNYRAFAHIPASLRTLYFHGIHWDLEIFVHLPSTVASFKAPTIENFSLQVAQQLPLKWLFALLHMRYSFNFDHYDLLDRSWPKGMPKTPTHEQTALNWKAKTGSRGMLFGSRVYYKEHWTYL